MARDFHYYLKLAAHLQRDGILFPLVYSLEKFREKENYPFQQEQKRIVRQSVFSSLCNDNTTRTGKDKLSRKELVKLACEIADIFYSEGEELKGSQKIAQEIVEDLKKEKEIEEVNKELDAETNKQIEKEQENLIVE